jgi:hypothetical protein
MLGTVELCRNQFSIPNAEWYPASRHALPRPERCAPTSCRSRPAFPVPDLTVAIVAASANPGCGSPQPGTHFAAATHDSLAPLRMPADVRTCSLSPFGLFIMADSSGRASFLTVRGARRSHSCPGRPRRLNEINSPRYPPSRILAGNSRCCRTMHAGRSIADFRQKMQ